MRASAAGLCSGFPVAFASKALLSLLLLQSALPGSLALSPFDEAEMDFAHKHCEKIDLPHIYRKPGEPVYFSMEGTYDHYYYCKMQRANRVDCTADLVDQICTVCLV